MAAYLAPIDKPRGLAGCALVNSPDVMSLSSPMSRPVPAGRYGRQPCCRQTAAAGQRKSALIPSRMPGLC
jgi:hypothetical protein